MRKINVYDKEQDEVIYQDLEILDVLLGTGESDPGITILLPDGDSIILGDKDRYVVYADSEPPVPLPSQPDILKSILPMTLSTNIMAANGDAEQSRVAASRASSFATLVERKEWAVDMYTNPGDMVLSPDGAHLFIYSNPQGMKHTNALFYPGATGVYYWAIVPEMYKGNKVYPDIDNIIVAVKQGETWWNRDKTKRYVWVDNDFNSCTYYPGQPGVHSWQEASE